MKKLTFKAEPGSIKMDREQARFLGIDIALDKNEGELKTIGAWNVPVSYQAQCIDTLYEKTEFGTKPKEVVFFGKRKLTNLKQSGYELDGWVSIGGKKYSAFTSSILIEIDGKLINVACISARYSEYPK